MWGPFEWGQEFWGFGKRQYNCIEEDILEKRDGKLGSMCAKSLHVSWYTLENLQTVSNYAWGRNIVDQTDKVPSLTIEKEKEDRGSGKSSEKSKRFGFYLTFGNELDTCVVFF